MFNAFLPYEQDFREWAQSGEFPDVNPLTRDFIQHLVRTDAPRKLWRHQQEAVFRAIYSYELLQRKNLLLNIVTGGGKTAIIGAIMAWLKVCHGIDKFLVLCPNTIVRDRLEDDFQDAKVFRDFDLLPPGTEHYRNELGLHVMEAGEAPQGILENGVLLGNIQQLYQSHIGGRRNLDCIMRCTDRMAIFNDEAHNTPAPEYDGILFALSRKTLFRLDTTATPDRADGKNPDSEMIYEYGIADAQAEVPPIIKNIVVYQPEIGSVELTYTNPETGEKRTVDEMDEEFERIEKGLTSTQWVTDPVPMRKQIQITLARLEEQKRRAKSFEAGFRPLLFVVAICIKDAQQAKEMLDKEFHIQTLLVTEKSDDQEREEARRLGKADSRYEAVVSVLMLREGWDVPPVSVILLLRKFSSEVYGQQVVGRGLRLNVRDRDIQEICAIVDHEKLDHNWLWNMVGAKVRTGASPTLFGDEDLPPKRKPQVVVNPDMIIAVPDPVEAEKADFDTDLADITIDLSDYPNWQSILDQFAYGTDVEISAVQIDGYKVIRPGEQEGFVELHRESILGQETPQPSSLTMADKAELLKHSIRDYASDLLAEEGIGSNELGYFYGVIVDHVSAKLLDGKTVGSASEEQLQHALNQLSRVKANIQNRPGLVSSIVKYKKESKDASS